MNQLLYELVLILINIDQVNNLLQIEYIIVDHFIVIFVGIG